MLKPIFSGPGNSGRTHRNSSKENEDSGPDQ
jgi:hypothetical protein